MFELNVFLRDKLIGRSVFSAEEIRIGRAVDNEVQIDNLAFSRYHASIEDVKGMYVLKDFGSANGTYVNGQKVEGRYGLNDGDRIQIGKFTLTFGCDKKVAVSATVRDEAAYAVAGETIVAKAPDLRERPCPYVAFLEEPSPTRLTPPKVHHLAKDIFLVGSDAGCDLVLDAKTGAPPRVAAIIRGFRGFQLLAMAPGVQKNRSAVEARADLSRGDELAFAGATFHYQVGRPEAGAS